MKLKYEEILALIDLVWKEADKEGEEILSILDMEDYLKENKEKAIEIP